MKVTGQILKENREKQGLSQQEVATILKISPKTVEAMESGSEENLPPKSFLRGFVQSYAKLLKLNVTNIMQNFLDEMGSTHPKPYIKALSEKKNSSTAPSVDKAVSSNRFPLPIKAMIAIGIIFLILLLLFLTQQLKKYEKEATIAPVSQTVTSIKTDIKNTPTPTPLPIPSTSPPPVKKTSQKKASEKKIEKPSNKTAEKTVVKPKKKTEVKTEKALAQKQELIVEALSEVAISYSIDGKSKKHVNLAEDKIHIIRAKSNIALDISNGGSINIIHNGKDIGVPGAIGTPMTLNFPKSKKP